MKTIIVTGATSYIAKEVTKKLLQKGEKVIAVVRNPEKLSGLSDAANLKVVKCDMEEYHHLPSLVNEKCDGVFHFAWDGTMGDSRMDKMIQENNIKNSMSLLCAARELGCDFFVGAGSQAEYGICDSEVTEKHPENPITEYGKAKLAVKRMGMEYGRTLGMKFIWTRIFSTYGVGDSEGSMVMGTLRKMLKNEDVNLTGCTQMWDYTNVHDVSSAYIYIYIYIRMHKCTRKSAGFQYFNRGF